MKKLLIAGSIVIALTLMVTFTVKAEGDLWDKIATVAGDTAGKILGEKLADQLGTNEWGGGNLGAFPGPAMFSDHLCQNGICTYVIERECPVSTSSPLFILKNPIGATTTLEYFTFEKYGQATSSMAFYVGTTTSYTTASSSLTYKHLTSIVNAVEVATNTKAYFVGGLTGTVGANTGTGVLSETYFPLTIAPNDIIMGVATGTVGNIGQYGSVRDFNVDCRYKAIFRYHK